MSGLLLMNAKLLNGYHHRLLKIRVDDTWEKVLSSFCLSDTTPYSMVAWQPGILQKLDKEALSTNIPFYDHKYPLKLNSNNKSNNNTTTTK